MFHFMLKEGDQVGKISEKKLGIYIIFIISIQCIQCTLYTGTVQLLNMRLRRRSLIKTVKTWTEWRKCINRDFSKDFFCKFSGRTTRPNA